MSVILGLTGGISSGKSSISKMFNQKENVSIIDCDLIVDDLYKKDKELVFKIKETFGEETIFANNINRKVLGQIIYNSKEKREQLNKIVHPKVKDQIQKQMQKLIDSELIIIDAPLLYESNLDSICKDVICVTVRKPIQIQRLMKRDLIDEELAIKKIESQYPLSEKESKSKYIINNNMSILDTKKEFNQVFDRIVKDNRLNIK